jgi:hypothetical protein
LVIAEIKKPNVVIGGKEKNQPWRYVEELLERGLLADSTIVTCFVLGSQIKGTETGNDTKLDGRVTIIPMTYSIFVRRAEKRMLGLRDKLRDAPFLRELGMDADEFLSTPQRRQRSLFDLEATPAG